MFAPDVFRLPRRLKNANPKSSDFDGWHRRFLPLLEHCQICRSCDRYFKETPSNDQSACERGKALLVPVFHIY